MSNGFIHSVKVPRLYKTIAKIVQNVQEKNASLKTLIFNEKHPNTSGIFALATTTLQRETQLDRLILNTHILVNEPRLDQWLARVLITELLWGKGALQSAAKPVQTVLAYEQQLRDELQAINNQNAQDPTISNQPIIVRKPRYVRVNTLLLTVEDAIASFEREDWMFIPKCTSYSAYLKTVENLQKPYFTQDYHVPEVLVFPHKVAFFNHNDYLAGKIVLQDKASCIPSYLLNPPRGSTVLDMCAAPGMKTTHLAAILQNEGKIYATEVDKKRYVTLCDMVKNMDCICVEPMNVDALTLSDKECPNVEYILVDPSCSGSGMTDRQLMVENLTTDRLNKLQSFQVFLLRHALLNFPTVKRVIYSTCSINSNENECVVDEILQSIGDAYRLVPAKELFDDWVHFSSAEFQCAGKCICAKPGTDLTNGFFVAVFERNFDIPLPEYRRKGKKSESWAAKKDKASDKIENKVNADEQANEFRKKKKRGKKRKTGITEPADIEQAQTNKVESSLSESNPIQDCMEVHESEPDSCQKKKKKKRKDITEAEKTKEPEHGHINELESCLPTFHSSEDVAAIHEADVDSSKKKKKKKKNKDRDQEVTTANPDESIISISNSDDVAIMKVKKSKKKKERKDNEIPEVDAAAEKIVKKKKAKHYTEHDPEVITLE